MLFYNSRPILYFNKVNSGEVFGVIGNNDQLIRNCSCTNKQVKIINRSPQFSKPGLFFGIEIQCAKNGDNLHFRLEIRYNFLIFINVRTICSTKFQFCKCYFGDEAILYSDLMKFFIQTKLSFEIKDANIRI